MQTRSTPNKVRINAGKYRGRQITFRSEGVRPTKAIVRKTLMNWLRPVVVGRRCLDCFAGSGILAFDVLSEGAESVLCYDRSSEVIQDIQRNQSRLEVKSLQCFRADFPYTLPEGSEFDLVFIDPPFHTLSTQVCLEWLCKQKCLSDGALIYIEAPRYPESFFSESFVIHKQSASAGVAFYLLKYRI